MLNPSFTIQYTLLHLRAQLTALHQAALYLDLQGPPHPLPLSLLLERLLADLDQLAQDLDRPT